MARCSISVNSGCARVGGGSRASGDGPAQAATTAAAASEPSQTKASVRAGETSRPFRAMGNVLMPRPNRAGTA